MLLQRLSDSPKSTPLGSEPLERSEDDAAAVGRNDRINNQESLGRGCLECGGDSGSSESFRKEVLGWGPGDGRLGGPAGERRCNGSLATEGEPDTGVTEEGLLLRPKSHLVTYTTQNKNTHLLCLYLTWKRGLHHW